MDACAIAARGDNCACEVMTQRGRDSDLICEHIDPFASNFFGVDGSIRGGLSGPCSCDPET